MKKTQKTVYSSAEYEKLKMLMSEVHANGGRGVAGRRVMARLELQVWKEDNPKKMEAMLEAYDRGMGYKK